MRIIPVIFGVAGAALMSVGATSAQAAEGKYYDPANVASPQGNTVGYELYRTIGCPGKQLLDAGCPDQDSDGDGVPDSKDKCPKVPAPGTRDGCPADSDGDGIVDAKDKCPSVPAPGTKDGCPPDSDGDGIADAKDRCPSVPAPGTKDGCPPDSDGDGIVDAKDRCPSVPAPGTKDGCPPSAPAPKKLTLEGVNFDNDRAVLRPEAYGILDRAAASLKEWGDVKVEVAGHTDSSNNDDYNQALSQRRAEAVRSYLIIKGVSANRLTAKGYGESQPVADNGTEEGRFKNRRVELVPQQ
jgi:outer membrane protein OmpA-like peptidoglycan-associated protein